MLASEQRIKRRKQEFKIARAFAGVSAAILIAMAVHGIVSGLLGYFMLAFALSFGWFNVFEDYLRKREND